jgi:hypothetical protein
MMLLLWHREEVRWTRRKEKKKTKASPVTQDESLYGGF